MCEYFSTGTRGWEFLFPVPPPPKHTDTRMHFHSSVKVFICITLCDSNDCDCMVQCVNLLCSLVYLQHAPGVPRILVGNRLHLAFKRQVPTEQARSYAEKNAMTFFEVSPLCNFNVIESFTELSRIVLMRHGMEKFWRPNRGLCVLERQRKAQVGIMSL